MGLKHAGTRAPHALTPHAASTATVAAPGWVARVCCPPCFCGAQQEHNAFSKGARHANAKSHLYPRLIAFTPSHHRNSATSRKHIELLKRFLITELRFRRRVATLSSGRPYSASRPSISPHSSKRFGSSSSQALLCETFFAGASSGTATRSGLLRPRR
ncbi:hypothetical protein IE81DRAFT_134148 [Ceraceosorus guamensis]|uniref:Uncharacterized protein n=1 Tax=Ceraceosorus guamensis TaxID=1522189 RepID=A0A316W423_9BASI|nr:hypothetical protein IE81DRAFT_134148 [Ceraceosorus guamensis]PWN42365.1 hypothetical protein IE81DRAFT_134148 [Ceraceosorus guamensis]